MLITDDTFIQKLRDHFIPGRTVVFQCTAAEAVLLIRKQFIQRYNDILTGDTLD